MIIIWKIIQRGHFWRFGDNLLRDEILKGKGKETGDDG